MLHKILAIVVVLILLTLFSCMIAGDVFIAKIAFNSRPMNCETFIVDTQLSRSLFTDVIANVTAPLTIAATAPLTIAATAPLTIAATAPLTIGVNHSTCAELDNVQLGFARFRIVIFWIMFAVLTILGVYLGIGSIAFGTIGIILLCVGIILWVFMLVGGIFLSQFVFEASEKKCNNSTNYCYNLNDSQIFFAKLTSVLCFPLTFAVIGFCVAVLYKSV
jgi:hypothetical protein